MRDRLLVHPLVASSPLVRRGSSPLSFKVFALSRYHIFLLFVRTVFSFLLSFPNFPLWVFSWFRLCALFLLVWLIDVVLFPGL